MLSEQFAALIDECVAEVAQTSGQTRTFKPPANPMRVGGSGAKRRPADLSYLDSPVRAAGPSRRRRAVRAVAVAGALVGVLLLSGIWVMRAGEPRSAPPAPAVFQPRPAARSPQSAARSDLGRGLSCHQIERELMGTFQNPNGTFYSQSQADSVLAAEGASC